MPRFPAPTCTDENPQPESSHTTWDHPEAIELNESEDLPLRLREYICPHCHRRFTGNTYMRRREQDG